MSVDTRVVEWLRKMGYGGEIPSNLSKICNPSTAFIWEQLIFNVKPRQEVEHIRKNIIVNRLLKKPLNQQDEFSYPIKEIRIYMERRDKEKKVENLENEIEEKNQQIDELLKKNKALYVAIEHKKAKIKVNLEKTFLLDKKLKSFEEKVQKANDTLALAKHLTPVEMDENSNPDAVTETLEKCAEKLQELYESNTSRKGSNQLLNSSNKPVSLFMKTPNYFPKNTFQKYLDESSTFNEIVVSTRKHSSASKENDVHQNPNVNKRLFMNDDVKRMPKRESLGLLPDTLNISDEIDNFLLSPNKPEGSYLEPLAESIFESRTKNDIIEKLCSDQNIKESLQELLYTNNRQLIVTQWKNICANLFRELRVLSKDHAKLVQTDRSISKEDLAEFYALHIKAELEKDKNCLILKKLQDSFKKKKEEVLKQLANKATNWEQTKEMFDMKIEEAYLTGANEFLRKEIESARKVEPNNELQIVATKIKRLHDEITEKNAIIENLITETKRVVKSIGRIQKETSLCVEKLAPLMQDLSWANPMTQENNSKEIEIFGKFPLEFNRKFKMSQSGMYYRDISDTSFPSYLELDSHNAEMIANLMDSPYSFAEDVIFDLFNTKIVSNKLRSLQNSHLEITSGQLKNYTPEALQKNEQYIDSVVEQLEDLINSPYVNTVLAAPDKMEETLNLWKELPLGNYISEKRLLDGRNYKTYEEEFAELCKSLPESFI